MHMSTKEPEKIKIGALEVEVPEGITVEIKGNEIDIKGSLGSNRRIFNDALLEVKKSDRKLLITPVRDRGLEKKSRTSQISMKKEIENDIRGVSQYYERKMRMVFAHFPINVEVKGSVLQINNIIGERFPRRANIVGSTKIEAKGQNVRVYGTSLDDVSQTAANIRQACRIRNKDSRVFQDGLYHEIE